MSVAILLVSHQHIAAPLLNLCGTLHADTIQNCAAIEVPLDASVDEKLASAKTRLGDLQLQDGLIIITDMYGGTPSNIAQNLARQYHAPLLSGLNLPMLMRINNYRDAALPDLLDKAMSGGQQGISLHVYEDKNVTQP